MFNDIAALKILSKWFFFVLKSQDCFNQVLSFGFNFSVSSLSFFVSVILRILRLNL